MQENEYIVLILKHLNQETSPAEQAGLRQWLDADPDNRREYQAVEKIWKDSGQVLQDRLYDKEAAWKKVTGALALPPDLAENTAPRIFPRRKWLAAASVLLVLGTGAWWLYKGKTGTPPQTILAKDGPRQVTLPDGSLIDLRKGAVLTYTPPFNDDRKVELQGEAFFLLANQPSSPFRIRTAHAIIEQMGTTLLVKDLPASDEVIVTTGKVKFTDRNDPSSNVIVLPGRNMILAEGRFKVAGEKEPNFMSWRTGILEFRDEPLESAAAAIGDFFQLPVSISPDLRREIGKIRVNARFDHQPLEEVLEELRLTTGLSIQREKDVLVFNIK